MRSHGVGLSVAMRDGRLHDSLSLMLDPERPGALRVLNALHSGGLADSTPTGTAAIAVGLDANRLLDEVRSLMEELEPESGAQLDAMLASMSQGLGFDLREDLLATLGDRLSVAAGLPEAGFVPTFAGSLALRDASRFATSLAAVLEFATPMLGDDVELADLELVDAEAAGIARIAGAPFAPAWAIDGDALRFAASANALRSAIKSGGGEPLASHADFARCLGGTVGPHGDDVAALLYVDLAAAARFGLGFAEMMLPSLANELPVELDPAAFPDPELVAEYLSGMLLTLRVGDGYVVIDSSSPIGGVVFPLVAGGLFAPRPDHEEKWEPETPTSAPLDARGR